MILWKILYGLIWIWQFPQNLIGILLMRGRNKHILPGGLSCTQWKYPTLCLGKYLFLSYPGFLRYGWGRGILSMILGPLYFLLISLPSWIFLLIIKNPYYYLDFSITRLTLYISKKR